MPTGTEDPGTTPATTTATAPPSPDTTPETTAPPQPGTPSGAAGDGTPPSEPRSDAGSTDQAPAAGEEAPSDSTEAPAKEAPKAPSWEELVEAADPDSIRKNRRIMGIAGEMAQRLAATQAEALAAKRADELVEQRLKAREAQAQLEAKMERAKAGDFYALGQETADELLRQAQARDGDASRLTVEKGATDRVQAAVEEWSKAFPPEVLTAASEAWSAKPRAGDFYSDLKTYLEVFTPALADHLVRTKAAEQEAALFQKWEKERLPALRARALAEVNGGEPVPDNEGGTPTRQRVVTDDDVRRMPLAEYEQVFDLATGRPKANSGVIYKATRGVDPRQIAAAGRSF